MARSPKTSKRKGKAVVVRGIPDLTAEVTFTAPDQYLKVDKDGHAAVAGLDAGGVEITSAEDVVELVQEDLEKLRAAISSSPPVDAFDEAPQGLKQAALKLVAAKGRHADCAGGCSVGSCRDGWCDKVYGEVVDSFGGGG